MKKKYEVLLSSTNGRVSSARTWDLTNMLLLDLSRHATSEHVGVKEYSKRQSNAWISPNGLPTLLLSVHAIYP